MGIKRLFSETVIFLTFITLLVVLINSYQVRRNTEDDLKYLQTQYINATYEIYKNELIGNILIGNKDIIISLLSEISHNRNVGVELITEDGRYRVGNYRTTMQGSLFKLNLGNQHFAQVRIFPLKIIQPFNMISIVGIPLFVECIILFFGFMWLLSRIQFKVLNPINELSKNLVLDNIENYSVNDSSVSELKDLSSALKHMACDSKKKAYYEGEYVAAKQVAHDIRSPLACLNLLLSCITMLPEKQRVLMRSSVQRITDIANVLHNRTKKNSFKDTEKPESCNVMISSLLESLVTEKRAGLGINSKVDIDLNLDKSYGLFVDIDAIELCRVISNIFDNCLESFLGHKEHSIEVDVSHNESFVFIRITDNGIGIPENVLSRIGTRGYSYGKEFVKSAGSGLGVYHAISTIEEYGGVFKINSVLHQGTTVEISFPKGTCPKWFVPHLDMTDIDLVIILDDDQSIHDLWHGCFQQLQYKLNILNFNSIILFKEYLKKYLAKLELQKILCLVDYEFVGQESTGLDLVSFIPANAQTILVTSHDEDQQIRERVIKLGMGIIPKAAVPYVPIK